MNLTARKVLDSLGNPTIEVEVTAQKGPRRVFGRAAAPSGASKGRHEVTDFPEGRIDVAIGRRGLLESLKNVDIFEQGEIDAHLRELDGTTDLHELGGNTIVAASMAVAKAAASAKGVPLYEYLGGEGACALPYPLGNVLGGGKHAGRRAPNIQEFLVVPTGANSFSDAVFANSRVHKKVRTLIEAKDPTFTGGKGDEGAWAPNLDDMDALEIAGQACEGVGDELGFEIKPALDVAASALYDGRKNAYVYEREGEVRNGGEQIDFMVDLIRTYKLFYVEDPLQEEDFEGFAELTRKVGRKCLICGDDLFTTNVERIRKGVKMGAANAVLIKPNQIGTLSDAHAAIRLAKEHDCMPVISHRSGETPDETIAHLAVAWGCPLIKTGVVGGERVSKLNELIRIEEGMGKTKMGKLP